MRGKLGIIGAVMVGACGVAALGACSSDDGRAAPIDGGTSGGAGGLGGSGGNAAAAASGGSSGTGGTGGASLFDCTEATGSVPALKLTELPGTYDYPVFAVSPQGDARHLFVVEQPGVIRVLEDGRLVDEAFLDIDAKVAGPNDFGDERGLLGLAFAPDYTTSGVFYVHYSNQESGSDTMVARYARSSSNPLVADPASFREILTVDQPEGNHNGGSILFGKDGLLYVFMGDGGGAGDEHGSEGNGQNKNTRLGKVLRIAPNAGAGGEPFTVPSGNMPGGEPTIWSYGWRNPYRASFDSCTGDMYVGDVGQNAQEEIDVEPFGAAAGRNYGWRLMEGDACFNPSSDCQVGRDLILPAFTYPRGDGQAVVGGYVYRGSAIPGLRGTYLFADYASGKIWRMKTPVGASAEVSEITNDLNPDGLRALSSFGQDAEGELYVTQLTGDGSRDAGKLFRIDAE
jgi:glucose/arabinose dehydrogenase